MRLIDGGKLLEHIKDLPMWWADAGGVYGESMKYPSGMFDCEDVVGSIENVPTVDAVVVTRCKNCRYRGLIAVQSCTKRLVTDWWTMQWTMDIAGAESRRRLDNNPSR